MADPLDQARSLHAQGKPAEAARLALRAGQAELAARWYGDAQRLDPNNPEHAHDRGLALLESGQVGMAAQAQAQALAIDPEHVGARAQRAGALEALGDDEGAALELEQLLKRLGPHPTFHVRLGASRERAQLARKRRLVGANLGRLRASHLAGTTFAAEEQGGGSLALRASFATLSASLDPSGLISELRVVFDDMDASLQRSDLSYGGTTQDEDGRRVPLDEFTATAVIFLSEALGIETERARRVLQWLLTADAGPGPHRIAGAQVRWLVVEQTGERRYGLLVAPAPEMV